jgi:isochorismate synthase
MKKFIVLQVMNQNVANELSTQILALKAQKGSFALLKSPLNNTLVFFSESALNWQNLQNFTEEGFVVAPFLFGKTDDKLLFFSAKNSTVYPLQEPLSKPISLEKLKKIAPRSNATGKDVYLSLVQNAVVKINSGKALKLVTSRTKTFEKPSHWDGISAFFELCNRFQNVMVAWVYAPEVNLEWMGASPEQLLGVNNGMATSMSLAGTRVIGTNEPWGYKELNEQAIVTEYLESIYKKHCSIVSTTNTETLGAGTIEHLLTKISGQLTSESELIPLLQNLHPTPAVGAMPKQAIDYILENENHDRKLYAGFWGMISPRHCNLYVNLRCFEITDSEIIFYAGGGITASSDSEAEWEETERKIASTQAVVLP